MSWARVGSVREEGGHPRLFGSGREEDGLTEILLRGGSTREEERCCRCSYRLTLGEEDECQTTTDAPIKGGGGATDLNYSP